MYSEDDNRILARVVDHPIAVHKDLTHVGASHLRNQATSQGKNGGAVCGSEDTLSEGGGR
jgi:hypothetical protein